MAQLKERVERKEYSLQELLRSLKEKLHVVILDGMPEEYRLSVYNVNTREDLEKVRRLMNS
jgi:molybdopterin-guanine dinucleotide biosynthesis protein A